LSHCVFIKKTQKKIEIMYDTTVRRSSRIKRHRDEEQYRQQFEIAKNLASLWTPVVIPLKKPLVKRIKRVKTQRVTVQNIEPIKRHRRYYLVDSGGAIWIREKDWTQQLVDRLKTCTDWVTWQSTSLGGFCLIVRRMPTYAVTHVRCQRLLQACGYIRVPIKDQIKKTIAYLSCLSF
jgi:hypothetical protein